MSNRLKIDITTGLATVATINPLGANAPQGQLQVTCHAVTDAGAYVAATTGTAAIEVISVSGTEWEPLYESDGTTPRVIDLTADSFTFNIVDAPIKAIRATPDSLTGATVDGIRLAVYEAE